MSAPLQDPDGARVSGQLAHERSVPRIDCPYDYWTRPADHIAWRAGWDEAAKRAAANATN